MMQHAWLGVKVTVLSKGNRLNASTLRIYTKSNI